MRVVLQDMGVRFDKTAHTYDLRGKEMQGITPVVSWMYPRTYEGIPDEVLAKAAEYGTAIHSQIELYDELGLIPDGDAVKAYIAMKEANNLTTIANEYLVTDSDIFASSIDLVMDDGEGIVLADIKTTSQLHTDNVRLQLSIYAYLFELCNPTLKVTKLAAVWIPKAQYGKPRWQPTRRIPADVIEDILRTYAQGGDPEPWRNLIANMVEDEDGCDTAITDELVTIERRMKELKARSEELRTMLIERMKASGDTSTRKGDGWTISYTAPSTRTSFDSKTFQAQHGDLYNQYLKTTQAKESITIKIK